MPEFFFQRYVDGARMADDVLITKQPTLEDAIPAALRLCRNSPKSVLVYVPEDSARLRDEITRLRSDLAAVTAERDYVMAEGLFSADQIRILRAERDTAIAERDAAIEERDYVMAEGLFRDEQNEDLRKTVSKIWEQLGNPTYKELNGRTIHDLIDSVIYERNDIAARLREENERLREAFEKAANDMRPMLRSLISRNEAEEIVRRAARAAIEGVTEPEIQS